MLACEPYALGANCSLAIWLNSTMSTKTVGIFADHDYQNVVEPIFSPQTPFLVKIEE